MEGGTRGRGQARGGHARRRCPSPPGPRWRRVTARAADDRPARRCGQLTDGRAGCRWKPPLGSARTRAAVGGVAAAPDIPELPAFLEQARARLADLEVVEPSARGPPMARPRRVNWHQLAREAGVVPRRFSEGG